jgi:hypothetical protein
MTDQWKSCDTLLQLQANAAESVRNLTQALQSVATTPLRPTFFQDQIQYCPVFNQLRLTPVARQIGRPCDSVATPGRSEI